MNFGTNVHFARISLYTTFHKRQNLCNVRATCTLNLLRIRELLGIKNDLKITDQIRSDQIRSLLQNEIWSDLRSLFDQMILIWSEIIILVIFQYSVYNRLLAVAYSPFTKYFKGQKIMCIISIKIDLSGWISFTAASFFAIQKWFKLRKCDHRYCRSTTHYVTWRPTIIVCTQTHQTWITATYSSNQNKAHNMYVSIY